MNNPLTLLGISVDEALRAALQTPITITKRKHRPIRIPPPIPITNASKYKPIEVVEALRKQATELNNVADQLETMCGLK